MSQPKILHGRYPESWYKMECPYCMATNWYSHDNESDLSQVNVDSIQCHSCGKIFWANPPLEHQAEPENTARGLLLEKIEK